MKIRIIGSGSMWTSYNSASYMIDDDILVDVPNGMCKYLFKMNINPRNINNVLITHFHGDHYFDMPFYLLMKSRCDNKKVNIFCSKEGKNKIYQIFKLAFPRTVKKVMNTVELKYCFSDEFVVNNYKVKKYLVDHGNMKPSYGYILEFNGKKIGFTGDSTMCNTIEYMARECDYIFGDCMFINGNDKHMGIDFLKDLMEKNPKCKYVTSHMEDSTREELLKLKIENIIVPKDGDVIEI